VFIIVPMIRIMVRAGEVVAKVVRVIHLGANPVSGGIPLRERSNRGIISCIDGAEDISLFILLELFKFEVYISKNKGIIITEYIMK
jgi:hypothetical protein